MKMETVNKNNKYKLLLIIYQIMIKKKHNSDNEYVKV